MSPQQATEVSRWLEQHDLGQFASAFIEQEVDLTVLPSLSEQDLVELGLRIGHRRRFNQAIKPHFTGQTSGVAELQPDGLERRQLTVMFCDLVGATQLSSRLDPEDLRAAMHSYYKACQQAIVQHHGFIASYLGDGVLSYFGYPEAHETSAEAAVRAALAIIEAVGKLRAADGSRLGVRLGIATGMAVVGDLIGEGSSEMRSVIGQTPNLAARIQALAEPGSLYIAESTRALVKGQFNYLDGGVQTLKGIDTPVQVWRVLGETRQGSRFEALHPDPRQCIGRDAELALLERCWDDSQHGHARMVLIIGEAGLGKSRLLKAMEEVTHAHHTHQWMLQCSPVQNANPLFPLVSAWRLLIQLNPLLDAAENTQRIVTWLGTLGNDENVVLLADLLGVPTTFSHALQPMSADQKKTLTLRLLVDICRQQAELHPILMVVEDAHWIDPLTRQFIEAIASDLKASRLMLLVTTRPESGETLTAPDTVLVRLTRLHPIHAEQVIHNLSPGRSLPDETIRQIVDRSDGNPLYLEELSKAVLEHLHLGMRPDLLPTIIPASLHDSLMGRLDRLGNAKEVAQVASCLGRRFQLGFLCRLMARDAETVEDLLKRLIVADLIFRESSGPDAVYAFKHALLHDVAYESLLRGKRRTLHQRIVEIFESQYPDLTRDDPGLVAHHCQLGGLEAKEAFHLVASARKATRLMAVREALRYLERAESILSQLPPSPSVIEDHTNVIQALMDTGRFIILPTRLIELATKVRERQKSAGQAVNPLAQVPLLFQEGRAHLYTSNYPAARRIFESIQELGLRHASPEVQMKPGSAFSMTLNCQGDFTASLAFLHPGNVDRFAQQHNLIDYLAGLGWCGHALCQTGSIELGLQCSDRAIEESGRLGSAIYGAGANLWKCHALLAVRRHDDALASARRGIELAQASDVPYLIWHGRVLQALVHLRVGQRLEARQFLDMAYALLDQFPQGQICLLDYPPAIEAELAWTQGDGAQAIVLAEQAVAEARLRDGWFSESMAQRVLAMAKLANGAGLAGGLAHFERALQLMQQGGARAEQCFAKLLWAQALRDNGHPHEASHWIARACSDARAFGYDLLACEHLDAASQRLLLDASTIVQHEGASS